MPYYKNFYSQFFTSPNNSNDGGSTTIEDINALPTETVNGKIFYVQNEDSFYIYKNGEYKLINIITPEEKEIYTRLTISGLGNKFLADDGYYKNQEKTFDAFIDINISQNSESEFKTIKEAIDAGKVSLFLKNGVHYVNEPIFIDADWLYASKKRFWLEGESKTGTIIQSDTEHGKIIFYTRWTSEYENMINFNLNTDWNLTCLTTSNVLYGNNTHFKYAKGNILLINNYIYTITQIVSDTELIVDRNFDFDLNNQKIDFFITKNYPICKVNHDPVNLTDGDNFITITNPKDDANQLVDITTIYQPGDYMFFESSWHPNIKIKNIEKISDTEYNIELTLHYPPTQDSYTTLYFAKSFENFGIRNLTVNKTIGYNLIFNGDIAHESNPIIYVFSYFTIYDCVINDTLFWDTTGYKYYIVNSEFSGDLYAPLGSMFLNCDGRIYAYENMYNKFIGCNIKDGYIGSGMFIGCTLNLDNITIGDISTIKFIGCVDFSGKYLPDINNIQTNEIVLVDKNNLSFNNTDFMYKITSENGELVFSVPSQIPLQITEYKAFGQFNWVLNGNIVNIVNLDGYRVMPVDATLKTLKVITENFINNYDITLKVNGLGNPITITSNNYTVNLNTLIFTNDVLSIDIINSNGGNDISIIIIYEYVIKN